MRKQLLAIFSMFGLAGSSAPASAQAVKGSDEANKTTTESKIKSSKATQENQASAGQKSGVENPTKTNDAMKVKIHKAGGENAAGKSDAQLTVRKAGGEQQAQQDVVTEKIGPDKNAHKHLGGVKYEKQGAEGTAAKNDAATKAIKTGAEHSTTGSDQEKKHIKSNTAMGDGSVRKSTVGSASGGAGTGKVALQDIHIKGEQNAAESHAAQQDLQKKVDKATPK